MMGPIPEDEHSVKVGAEGAAGGAESALDCYEPLKSFEELMNYGRKLKDEEESLLSVSRGSGSGESSSSNSNRMGEMAGDGLSLDLGKKGQNGSVVVGVCPIIRKPTPLNRNFSEYKVSFDGRRVKGTECPQTLVCHDFKGGYKDDRFVDGTDNPENYTFQHWLQTDIFCYFSHHFVTIPTLGWINAAHSHGVKVIGTIITEWDDGIKLCDEILKDSETIERVVQKLSLIVQDYGFEGYLVNIENVLKERDVPLMIEFLTKLTKSLKHLSQDNLVIWYDSVTVEGKLKWQDCLNDLNKAFFDACDGIYLNYNWNDEKLNLSKEMAKNRQFDVYVGVDVFGRGCFGGGGINTGLAVEKIASHNLSYAIFAPGWSFECNPYDTYPRFDDMVWMPCAKHFFYRCLRDEYNQNNLMELLSPSPDSSGRRIKVHFSTNFCRGFGIKKFCFGDEPSEKSWFNISLQNYQPILYLGCTEADHSDVKERKVYFDTTKGFSGGGCLRLTNLKKRPNYVNPLTCSPIWFPLDIPILSSRVSIAVLAAWRSASIEDQLQIFLEASQPGMKPKKVLLGSVDHLATSVAGKFYIHLKLSHFLQNHLHTVIKKTNDIEFFFRKNNYDEKEIHGWRISCFLFDIDQNRNKYNGIHGLRIGAEGDISLGFLSLAQITHYDDDIKN